MIGGKNKISLKFIIPFLPAQLTAEPGIGRAGSELSLLDE
jgi:hypothetical protein